LSCFFCDRVEPESRFVFFLPAVKMTFVYFNVAGRRIEKSSAALFDCT
jgi:hypothetical protein